MKIFITSLLLPLIIAGWLRPCAGAETNSGENLVHISSGVSGPISYGLFRGAPPASLLPGATTCDLVLIVRNVGNNVLRLHRLLPSDFILKDARTGDSVSLTLVSKPAAIAHGRGTVIHLRAEWWPVRRPMPEKGVLTVKANSYNFLPKDLIFGDISLDGVLGKK